MAIAPRDREALDLVQQRTFSGSFLASLELELQARRLTLAFYGSLGGGRTTVLGTIRFFGAAGLVLANDGETFPESVGISGLQLSYDDQEDAGSASLTGAEGWSMDWSFDGLAYEEHPAVIASLADDD